jgi:hypothetical protein
MSPAMQQELDRTFGWQLLGVQLSLHHPLNANAPPPQTTTMESSILLRSRTGCSPPPHWSSRRLTKKLRRCKHQSQTVTSRTPAASLRVQRREAACYDSVCINNKLPQLDNCLMLAAAVGEAVGKAVRGVDQAVEAGQHLFRKNQHSF